MAKIFSTNLLNWLKTKVYMKSEVDVKLDGKSDVNHVHTANSIQFEESDSGCEYWMEEGYNTQNDVNGILFEAWQKVEGIEDNANKIVVDSSLSATSTNPVENRVVNNALSGKASSTHSHNNASTAMNGFMSSNDKTKLDGIATGATRNIVDSSLSTTSTNPVQNKIINTALTKKSNTGHTHGVSLGKTSLASNFFCTEFGNIAIISWWSTSLNVSTANSWQTLHTLPVTNLGKCVWTTNIKNGSGVVYLRVNENSSSLQYFSDATGNVAITAGQLICFIGG